MRLLLDTAALLWWIDDDRTLGSSSRAAIADADAEVFVSSANAWEIALKHALGKLDVDFDISDEVAKNEFLELPITVGHAVAAAALPMHHKDPFDRMLVAQAQLEDLTLVSSDAEIAKYDVALLDART